MPLNVLSETESTLPKLVMDVIPVPLKASVPRDVKFGRFNSPDNNEHRLKELFPIDVAPDKSVVVICKEEQS